jgi:ribosomal-protein-alanine N-acetyltransferase
MAFERLETERLLIRPLTVEDLEALHTVFSDPQVMRHVPGGARDSDGTRARLQSLIDHQRENGFSKWAVVERESGAVIGDCGLQYLDGGPDIEIGFHIVRSRWGRGYATEAARACLIWARVERPERIVAIVDPANVASVRVLEKLGLQPEGTAAHFGREWHLYVDAIARADGGDLELRRAGSARHQ